jgi:pimeloyl-ACP methyl ester carboxylesterase
VDLEASRDFSDRWHAERSTDVGVGGPRCPVRVLCGSAESEDQRGRAESFAQRLDRASIGIIPGAAHFLPLEQAGALAAQLRAFERSCAGASR